MATLDISLARAVLIQPLYGCLCIINTIRNVRRETAASAYGFCGSQQRCAAMRAAEGWVVKKTSKTHKLYCWVSKYWKAGACFALKATHQQHQTEQGFLFNTFYRSFGINTLLIYHILPFQIPVPTLSVMKLDLPVIPWAGKSTDRLQALRLTSGFQKPTK